MCVLCCGYCASHGSTVRMPAEDGRSTWSPPARLPALRALPSPGRPQGPCTPCTVLCNGDHSLCCEAAAECLSNVSMHGRLRQLYHCARIYDPMMLFQFLFLFDRRLSSLPLRPFVLAPIQCDWWANSLLKWGLIR